MEDSSSMSLVGKSGWQKWPRAGAAWFECGDEWYGSLHLQRNPPTNRVVKYYDRGPTEIHQGDRVLEVPQVENKSHQGWSSPLHTHLRSSGTSPSMSPEKLLHRSRPTSPLLDESLKSPSCRVHGFVKSMSVTSLSGKSLQSSPTRRRGRSISTESDFHTQETSITREPQNGWRETCWTKKGETPEDRLSSKGEGVDEPATGKESRARLDSFLARRPSSSEGEVYSGEN